MLEAAAIGTGLLLGKTVGKYIGKLAVKVAEDKASGVAKGRLDGIIKKFHDSDEQKRQKAFREAFRYACAKCLEGYEDDESASRAQAVIVAIANRSKAKLVEVFREEAMGSCLFAERVDTDQLKSLYANIIENGSLARCIRNLPSWDEVELFLHDFLITLKAELSMKPEFQPLLNTQALQDMVIILSATQDDISAMRKVIAPEIDPDKVLAEYLDDVLARNQRLDPRGIFQTNRQVAPKLDEVYISLDAVFDRFGDIERNRLEQAIEDIRSREDLSDEERERLIEQLMQPYAQRSERTTERHVDLAKVVRQHSHLIILGAPGSGKTTLTRYLAYQFARACKDGARETVTPDGKILGPVRLPILMRIAYYAEARQKDKDLALTDYLPNYLEGQESNIEGLRELVKQYLQEGRCIVILDGLDEVAERGERLAISRCIDRFISEHSRGKENRFVITSRIEGYAVAPLLASELEQFTICDMEMEKIKQFVQKWCYAVEGELYRDNPTMAKQRAEEESEKLMKAIEANPGVRRLAANPLLLTILSLIQRSGTRLPQRRIELYELATKTLLYDWRLAQEVNPDKLVTENEGLRFLGPLAYWIHENYPTGIISEAEAKQKIAEELAKERGEDNPDSLEIQNATDDFLERVREQTGLFVERGRGRYGFMHLTFEEYFTARELVRDPFMAEQRIRDHLHQSRWREPILLGIAFLSTNFIDSATHLVQQAIWSEKTPSLHEDVLHRDLLFACACLGDGIEVKADVRQRLVESMLKIYFDRPGKGKYQKLREDIGDILKSYVGSAAALNVERISLAALKDESEYVRLSAAYALGNLESATPEAVKVLLEALNDESKDVRRSVAALLRSMKDALGSMGDAKATKALLEMFKDENEGVRISVALVLGKLRSAFPKAVKALLKALNDESVSVRILAADALRSLQSATPEAVKILLEALNDENESVRISAAAALVSLQSATPEAVKALLEALNDESVSVRISAAAALVSLQSATPEAVKALLEALNDESVSVRISAADALRSLQSATPEAVKALLEALNDESVSVRGSAAEALGKFSLVRNEMTADLDWQEIAEALRAALGNSEGKSPSSSLSLKTTEDVIFEALMQVVERLEEETRIGQSPSPA